jgi:very-short-patch-repair endonuclease
LTSVKRFVETANAYWVGRLPRDDFNDFPALVESVFAEWESENLSWVFENCGSPIEKMMLSALMVLRSSDIRLECETEITLRGGKKISERDVWNARMWSPREGLVVHLQKQIQDMRVDFLVVQRYREFSAAVVVECDGHEFHERTKEQASSDRARDRKLQALGYDILRYPGSDIWRDVHRCAVDVLIHLDRIMSKQALRAAGSVDA